MAPPKMVLLGFQGWGNYGGVSGLTSEVTHFVAGFLSSALTSKEPTPGLSAIKFDISWVCGFFNLRDPRGEYFPVFV